MKGKRKSAVKSVEGDVIDGMIYLIRGQKVMQDSDLASLYGVETKVLNQAVKRNLERFPPDFMVKLTKKETQLLKSEFEVPNWHLK